MGVSQSTVSALRDAGHDIFHLRERELKTLADDQILELARDEDRIVVTFDLDFGELMAYSGDSHPSVILFRIRRHTPSVVSAFLLDLLVVEEAALREGVFITVNDSGYRLRRMPLQAG